MLWGIVTTALAPRDAILRFCAHHIDAGAARIHLYLDDPDAPELPVHPCLTVRRCDAAHWRALGGRPEKHQKRQTLNATDAYRHAATELDWLAHIDVDEFIAAPRPVASELASLPPETFSARIRPMEPLAGAPGLFKAAVPGGPERAQRLARIYPRWSDMLRSGLLSHKAGKLLVRTGAGDLTFRIHNVQVDGVENPGLAVLQDVWLAHLHAADWEAFRAAYRFRLEQGSYRAELAPNRPRAQGGVTMHELLSVIEAEDGDAGLRAFFDEVCTAHPDLTAALDREGLLRHVDLNLDATVNKVFPGSI